ncbi:flagellar export chaperone FliS [Planctomycetota bacterium]|nr:flagellar export chaperone FliS [Planctomycetota bacterium]
MNQAGPNPYLRTKVLTASSEDLRLLLFDGVIRFCNQAKKAITEGDFETSYSNIVKAQKIVQELSNSLNHKVQPEVTEKMASLYNYLYRRLVDANMSRNAEALDETIKLIQYERETWQLLIKKVNPQTTAAAKPAAAAARPAVGGYGQAVATPKPAGLSGYSQSA